MMPSIPYNKPRADHDETSDANDIADITKM